MTLIYKLIFENWHLVANSTLHSRRVVVLYRPKYAISHVPFSKVMTVCISTSIYDFSANIEINPFEQILS